MDQDARHGGGGTAYSLLRHQTLSTALSLPHHTIFLGDCADPRSDGLDNETSSSFDSHNNSNNNYYFSKPIMVLDLIWNLAFVAVSVAVLFSASKEKPSTPLRIWVSGYSLQCLLHVAFVYFQHQNRRRIDRDDGDGGRVRIEVPPSSQTHSRCHFKHVTCELSHVFVFCFIFFFFFSLTSYSCSLQWLIINISVQSFYLAI